jgi:hypothetical protein
MMRSVPMMIDAMSTTEKSNGEQSESFAENSNAIQYAEGVKPDRKSELWKLAIAEGKPMAAFAFTGSADAYRRGLVQLARACASDAAASELFDSLGIGYASNDAKYIQRTFKGYGSPSAGGTAPALDADTLGKFGF